MAPVDAMRGKFTKEKTKILRPSASKPQMNPRKTQYLGGRYNPSTGRASFFFKNAVQNTPPTGRQEYCTFEFGYRVQYINNALDDPILRPIAEEAFRNQTRYSTLRGYVLAVLYGKMPNPFPF